MRESQEITFPHGNRGIISLPPREESHTSQRKQPDLLYAQTLPVSCDPRAVQEHGQSQAGPEAG
jgi:hypothetical protein